MTSEQRDAFWERVDEYAFSLGGRTGPVGKELERRQLPAMRELELVVEGFLEIEKEQWRREEKLSTVLYDAISYTLNRVQTEPEWRWHMLLTETFERLVRAEAAYTGRPEEEVMSERMVDCQPEYRRRRAECAVNRERVRVLELLLEEHGVDVPPRRDT